MNQLTQKTPILYGIGASNEAGNEIKKYGCRKILFGYDSRINFNGVVDKVRDALIKAGLTLIDMDLCEIAEPTDVDVDLWAKLIRKANIDGAVALGGGSVIDLTRGVTGLVTNPGSVRDYLYHRGVDPNFKNQLPVISIPTTAGSGSEVSESAVVTDTQDILKSFFRFSSKLAILDPEMTIGMPPLLTAETGMDAMSHLMETYLSRKANYKSDALALYFMKEVVKWLPIAIEEPNNLEARGLMLCAASFGGINFNNASLAMGHGIAHCIGAYFNIGHGLTCAFVFPEYLRLCSLEMPNRIKEIGEMLGATFKGKKQPEVIGDIAASQARKFLHKIGIPSVGETGISREKFVAIAHDVYEANKNTIYNANTPCKRMTEEDILGFLERTYDMY